MKTSFCVVSRNQQSGAFGQVLKAKKKEYITLNGKGEEECQQTIS